MTKTEKKVSKNVINQANQIMLIMMIAFLKEKGLDEEFDSYMKENIKEYAASCKDEDKYEVK